MNNDLTGEQMDIEAAFRKYHIYMQRHLISFCGDETTAKDAVSQAFTSAWIHRIALELMPEPAAKAWLYAAARNAAVDIKRKESRLTAIEDHDIIDDQFDPVDKITIRELIQKLPPELSIPVHMKYFQGYNSTEIGDVMGISPATVRTRLKKALTTLRNLITTE